MPAPSAAAAQTSDPDRPRGHRRAAGTESGAVAGAGGTGGTGGESAGDVVRWAAFCCVLVPVVLLVYGTSLGGASGTALGLAAVTAACRVLLRRSERGLRAEATPPHRSRHSHSGRNSRHG